MLYRIMIFPLLAVLLYGCSSAPDLAKWEINMPIVGSNSSPKCIDLNQDGVLDIVLGCGKNEFEPSPVGVIALNGATGDTLWTAPASDQIYGSPIFQDVNDDEVPDVFISGRALNLYCLDGKTGEQIWSYMKIADDYTPGGLARFNFYNPVFVGDESGDGIDDLLILNSGNVDALPYDSLNRHPGVLLLLDSKNGTAIKLDTMPDGKESYMSPVVYDFNDDGRQSIIIGTGGETISGDLYEVAYEDFMSSGLSTSRRLLTYKNEHGFIAPPLVADLNKDGNKDLISINHGGRIAVLSGAENLSLLWEVDLIDVELNSQATVGYFNEDDYLDLFVSGALGKWPKNKGSKHYFIDGKDGSILKTYEKGCSGFSSPLTMNIDDDPQDEALIYINDFDCRRYNTLYNIASLHIFDLDTIGIFAETSGFGKNISSTPWIGDLDGDKNLDLVSVVAENTRIFHEFLGFKVVRNEYHYVMDNKIKWASYMGEENRCIYAD